MGGFRLINGEMGVSYKVLLLSRNGRNPKACAEHGSQSEPAGACGTGAFCGEAAKRCSAHAFGFRLVGGRGTYCLKADKAPAFFIANVIAEPHIIPANP